MVSWIKFDVNFFEDARALRLFSNNSGYRDISVYMNLLCLAGKLNTGGRFVDDNGVVYTDAALKKLLKLTARSFASALGHLIEVGLIGKSEDGVYYIPDWGKLQNEAALSKMREAKKHKLGREEKDKDTDKDREKEKEGANFKSSLCNKVTDKTLNTSEKTGRDHGNDREITEKTSASPKNEKYFHHDNTPEDVKAYIESGEVALSEEELDELRAALPTSRIYGMVRLIGKYMKPFGREPHNAYRLIMRGYDRQNLSLHPHGYGKFKKC